MSKYEKTETLQCIYCSSKVAIQISYHAVEIIPICDACKSLIANEACTALDFIKIETEIECTHEKPEAVLDYGDTNDDNQEEIKWAFIERRKKYYYKVKCDICEKLLLSKEKLEIHKRVHTGERPFKCETCLAAFKQEHHLIDHRRIHTNEKPFTCKFCLVSFKQKQHLNCHVRIHTGTNSYVCDICQKSFSRSQNLRLHKQIHGDQWHNCPICSKPFKQLQAMKNHKKIHSMEKLPPKQPKLKLYECVQCSSSFSYLGNLTKHQELHNNNELKKVVLFECANCHKKFKRKPSLVKHMKKHLKDTEEGTSKKR